MRRKFFRAIGANAYAQAVTILVQIFTLPAFLAFVPLQTYGVWLLLSALPAYLMTATIGLLTVGRTDICVACEEGQFRTAVARLKTNYLYVNAFGFLAGVVLLALTPWILSETRPIPFAAVCLLLLTGLVTANAGLADTLYRTADQYARGAAILNTVRLLEWISTVVGLAIFKSIEGAAAGALTARVIGTVLVTVDASRRSPLQSYSASGEFHYSHTFIRKSALYTAIPFGDALSMQGLIVAVGAGLGPTAVAMFGAYRTVSRTIVQLTGIFSNAIWPQLTQMYAAGEKAMLVTAYRKVRVISLICAVFGCGLTLIVGEQIIKIWSKGALPFDASLLFVFLVYAVIGALGHVPRILLIATNNQTAYGLIYLLSSVFLLIAVMLQSPGDVLGFAIAATLFEFLNHAIATLYAKRFLLSWTPSK